MMTYQNTSHKEHDRYVQAVKQFTHYDINFLLFIGVSVETALSLFCVLQMMAEVKKKTHRVFFTKKNEIGALAAVARFMSIAIRVS